MKTKGSEQEMNKLRENRMEMDPDSWTLCRTDDPATNSDTHSKAASQPDTGTIYQSKHNLSGFGVDVRIPRQWSSTCCYGRGKTLEDIFIPRIPKALEKELDFPAADCSLLEKNWQNMKRSTPLGYSLPPARGVGRGKICPTPPISRPTDQETSDLNYIYREAPGEPSQTSAAPTISCPTPTPRQHLLITSGFGLFSEPTYKKEESCCLNSEQDFPSLSAGRLKSSGPDHSRETAKRPTLSNIFEDAYFPHALQGMKAVTQNSTDADLCEFSADTSLEGFSASTSVEKKTDKSVECTNGVIKSFLPELSRDSDAQRHCTRKPDRVENLGLKSGPKGSDDGASSDKTLSTPSSNTHSSRECGVPEGGLGQENPGQTEHKEEDAEEDRAADPRGKAAVKPRRKIPSGWKMDGACVVHVAHVPKGCAGKLREMVGALAMVVDFEKKTKAGIVACRFRFESKAVCDHIVSCLDGSSPFDGYTKTLECHRLEGEEVSETDE
ncbi:hypothetical protein ACOMHN_043052 [Nucella lapillus]